MFALLVQLQKLDYADGPMGLTLTGELHKPSPSHPPHPHPLPPPRPLSPPPLSRRLTENGYIQYARA